MFAWNAFYWGVHVIRQTSRAMYQWISAITDGWGLSCRLSVLADPRCARSRPFACSDERTEDGGRGHWSQNLPLCISMNGELSAHGPRNKTLSLRKWHCLWQLAVVAIFFCLRYSKLKDLTKPWIKFVNLLQAFTFLQYFKNKATLSNYNCVVIQTSILHNFVRIWYVFILKFSAV